MGSDSQRLVVFGFIFSRPGLTMTDQHPSTNSLLTSSGLSGISGLTFFLLKFCRLFELQLDGFVAFLSFSLGALPPNLLFPKL